MSEHTELEPTEANWKPKLLIAGALLGALVGASAAYLLAQRAERENGKLKMSAGEGVKIGVLVFGLLRQVAQLSDGS